MPKLLLSDIDNLITSDELELISFACAIKDISKLLDDIEDMDISQSKIVYAILEKQVISKLERICN